MRIRLAIAVAPVWVWVAVISALPHKEERFLFPVYTLVSPYPHCDSAGADNCKDRRDCCLPFIAMGRL